MNGHTLIPNSHGESLARSHPLAGLAEYCRQLLDLEDSTYLLDDVIKLIQKATASNFAEVYIAQEEPQVWQEVAHCSREVRSAAESRECFMLSALPAISAGGVGETRLTASAEVLPDRMVDISRRGGRWLAFIVGRTAHEPPYLLEERLSFEVLASQARLKLENSQLQADLERFASQAAATEQALGQTEKMAAVGRLMASIAHEVNNPLQSIGTCIDLAGRKELSIKRRQSYLRLAKNELERLGQTLQRMLEFYRPGVAERLPILINPLIERVLTLVQQKLFEQKIRLHLILGENLPPVVAASALLQQVFFNLVVNAIEAMPDGGDLRITSLVSGNDVKVLIQDSGAGIQEEIRDRLFEPFRSTKPGGSDLGLSVSYGIIQAHGGDLRLVDSFSNQAANPWADCVKGRNEGACFEVTLPSERKIHP